MTLKLLLEPRTPRYADLRATLLSQTSMSTVVMVIVRDVSDCILLDPLAAIWTYLEAVFNWGNMMSHEVLVSTRCTPIICFVIQYLPSAKTHDCLLSCCDLSGLTILIHLLTDKILCWDIIQRINNHCFVTLFTQDTPIPFYCTLPTLGAVAGVGGVKEARGDASELGSQAAPGELVYQAIGGDD
jgi:hypothetical protein